MKSEAQLDQVHKNGVACGQVAAEMFLSANENTDPSLYVELVNGIKGYDSSESREAYVQGYLVGIEIELLNSRKAILDGCRIIRRYVELHGQSD